MQKEETAKVSKYYVCGFVTNEKDAAVPDATVKVEVGEFKADLTTDNRGYFNIEVAAQHWLLLPFQKLVMLHKQKPQL